MLVIQALLKFLDYECGGRAVQRRDAGVQGTAEFALAERRISEVEAGS